MGDRAKVLPESDYRWQDVPLREYKADGDHFKGITRQNLLGEGRDEEQLRFITRYFEIEPGGYSTLERHQHPHAVVVVRGRGRVLLERQVRPVKHLDAVYVPPGTLHQFYADDEPLGFLCTVDRERDRPTLPDDEELRRLREDPMLRNVIRA